LTAPLTEPRGSATPARPSALIARALVERQSARQIADRATEMGLPRTMVQVIVAACGCNGARRASAN
jgi:hypothetical protein